MARLIDIDKLEDPFKGTPQEGNWITTMLAQLLRTAPRADAEYVRHGHWIKVEAYDDGGLGELCRCSNCNETVWISNKRKEKHNYCSSCGAKMDEVTW